MLANLAAVFHWQPSELKALTLDELPEWHTLAKERAPKVPEKK
ncbi:MAG: GpE family phage tail protein [Candidatus Sedimenticola sp. (ex Thyasira tokunagai)]